MYDVISCISNELKVVVLQFAAIPTRANKLVQGIKCCSVMAEANEIKSLANICNAYIHTYVALCRV